MLTFIRYANVDASVLHLLKLTGITISPKKIVSELEIHPDYPSILSISDVLAWFNVQNDVYEVQAEELIEVPVPFIAHTRGNEFVTVSRITADTITLSDHERDMVEVPLKEFAAIYSGVVLKAETPDATVPTRTGIVDKLAVYKTPVALTCLLLVFIGIVLLSTRSFTTLTWHTALLLICKTAGLITTVLLLAQSINKNNPLAQILCGGNSKTNCNAILTSQAANVFKGLTWSEVGFFYFAGTWLALLAGNGQLPLLQELAILNIISLPYTAYSIYYQARVARQWCVLCTTVQALLWLEFASLVTYLGQPVSFTAQSVFILLICLVAPVAAWMLLKPVLLNAQQSGTLRYQLKKFKYNRQLFTASLKEQAQYTLPADEWSIVLGNPEAHTVITMVSNPYCPPCGKTHQELDEWLDKLDDIQVRIVFTAFNTDNDKKTPVARHMMALNEQCDKTVVKKALHDWYRQEQKDYEKWARQYPVMLDESRYVLLDKQKDWCEIAEVRSTPTLMINGYRLPKTYRLGDVKYMLN
ncbi:MAG: vitamin K epoxide reductase family protein [Chitinophagaceae bacterium]